MEVIEDGEKSVVATYFYDSPKERQRFSILLDDLVKRHAEAFPDREAAFTVFARAYFTGNLLPLGRLLEETYGKNALRRLLSGDTITSHQ